MNYRLFGRTGIRVSEVGFGGWGIGGYVPHLKAYGPKDDKESIRALRKAFDLGVNFFDTACSYGAGHSEELIGKTFSKQRGQIIIATKFGYLNKFNPVGPNVDFTCKGIINSLSESLDRLRTDYIDIYQIHDCPYHCVTDELVNCLLDLKRYGTIRCIGFAGRSPDDTLKVIKKYNIFDSIQINFNLTDMRAIKNGLFSECFEQDIAIIARTPLVFGFLTGKIDENTEFHESDHRRRFSENQKKKWISVWEYYKHILGDPKYRMRVKEAIGFCLSFPQVSTVNVGMSTCSHVIDNLSRPFYRRFMKHEINRLISAYDQHYSDTIVR